MKNQKLLDALYNCITHCNHCADACLDTDNIKMMVDCIRTDRASAEVCSTTAKLLAMDSAFAKAMVEKCHEICIQCAEECEGHENQHCKDCAEACRACAAACKEYLA